MSVDFRVGDPVPWFVQKCSNGNDRYNFDTIAGRYIILSFFGSASDARSQKALNWIIGPSVRDLLDDENVRFFGVTIDPSDQTEKRVRHQMPGIAYFWDFDRRVSRLYGAIDDTEGTQLKYHCFTLLLDPTLRVLAFIPYDNIDAHNETLLKVLKSLPPPNQHAMTKVYAPISIVPRVLEPSFCRELVDYYHRAEKMPSGFMQEKDGKTIYVEDTSFKRRTDAVIEEDRLIQGIRERIFRRLVPEIKKAHQFNVTQIERFIVACYDGETGGYFNPHRDNTTKGTIHRRFAVTINLNTGEYDGGLLRFPEFGEETYCAPTGGAVVFSCSLLHEALPVTRGKRYATLPFLYDDYAAAIREENKQFIDSAVYDRSGNKRSG